MQFLVQLMDIPFAGTSNRLAPFMYNLIEFHYFFFLPVISNVFDTYSFIEFQYFVFKQFIALLSCNYYWVH